MHVRALVWQGSTMRPVTPAIPQNGGPGWLSNGCDNATSQIARGTSGEAVQDAVVVCIAMASLNQTLLWVSYFNAVAMCASCWGRCAPRFARNKIQVVVKLTSRSRVTCHLGWECQAEGQVWKLVKSPHGL